MEYVTLSVRPEDHRRLRAVALVRGLSQVELIEELAQYALDQLDPDQHKLAKALERSED